jgi:hypothetical protein
MTSPSVGLAADRCEDGTPAIGFRQATRLAF